MVHLNEIITEVTPVQERPHPDESAVRCEYDRVVWENVDHGDMVSDDHLTVWGGYPGSYDTVDASGFDAVQAYFDSALSDANVAFVTDDGVYIYDFVADQIDESTLAGEVFSILRTLSRRNVIKGLRPTEDIAPPRNLLHEHLEFHQDIEAFEIEQCDGSLRCRVVLKEEREPDSLLQELRVISGVQYSQPDSIKIVEAFE